MRKGLSIPFYVFLLPFSSPLLTFLSPSLFPFPFLRPYLASCRVARGCPHLPTGPPELLPVRRAPGGPVGDSVGSAAQGWRRGARPWTSFSQKLMKLRASPGLPLTCREAQRLGKRATTLARNKGGAPGPGPATWRPQGASGGELRPMPRNGAHRVSVDAGGDKASSHLAHSEPRACRGGKGRGEGDGKKRKRRAGRGRGRKRRKRKMFFG